MRKQFRICRDGREAILKMAFMAFPLFVFRMEQCGFVMMPTALVFPHQAPQLSYYEFYTILSPLCLHFEALSP